jgi:hypothetical protein
MDRTRGVQVPQARSTSLWDVDFKLPDVHTTDDSGTDANDENCELTVIPKDSFAILDSVLLSSKLGFGQHLQASSWRDLGLLLQKGSDSCKMLTKL